MEQKLLKLKEALAYLENNKLLDLNEHSITAENGQYIYGFMKHEDKLRVITPTYDYSIDDIPADVLEYIFEGSKAYLDLGSIFEHIQNKFYQINSI